MPIEVYGKTSRSNNIFNVNPEDVIVREELRGRSAPPDDMIIDRPGIRVTCGKSAIFNHIVVLTVSAPQSGLPVLMDITEVKLLRDQLDYLISEIEGHQGGGL